MKKKKTHTNPIWGSNFNKEINPLMEQINSSIEFDKRLALQDLNVSLVHCKMLKKQKIINSKDSKLIISGLKKIELQIQNNKFEFNKKYEDIHMNIEVALKKIIGDTAGKLHSARSRNDQVVTDFKLWVKDAIKQICFELTNLQKIIIKKADSNIYTYMPGFTHLQPAQIVSFAHHLMAYCEMFKRDKLRFLDCFKRLNECPLGSAALAGTTFPIDRFYTAKLLGFEKPTSNSMDSVSDRDFAAEFLSTSAICGSHLSRFSEDIIIWASEQFKFINLSDAFSTGSSIMPQKKNPDSAELVRGKTGRLNSNLINLLTTLKGLPLSYNKDLQEDKEPVFDSFDNLLISIKVLKEIIKGMEVRKKEMLDACNKGNLIATDLAEWIVINLKVPFRTAYKITAKIIKIAKKNNCQINALKVEQLNFLDTNSKTKIEKFLKQKDLINNKNSFGGTAPQIVKKAIQKAKRNLY